MIRSLLLVEDDYLIADTAVRALGAEGIVVLPVPDGRVALQSIEVCAFDAVVVDLNLPGNVDRIALVLSIQAARPGVPVVITTGYDREAIKVPDGIPIVEKPYRFGELLHALRAEIARRRL